MKRVLWFAIVLIARFAFVQCAIATESIEPLSGALTFDKVSVAVGEPLKATLESSGGTPPYRVSYVSWRISEEGFGEIVGESGGTIDGNTYSLTPTRGNQCRLIIKLEDSGNRYVFVETPWIPIIGAPAPPAPLSGILTFDKESVAVGEPLKATLESSGGTPPYRVSYVSWRISEEGFGEIVGESGGTIDGNTYSLTPTRGNQCRLIIKLEDSGNRYVFVETPWIPVFVRTLVSSVFLGEDICTLRQGETFTVQPQVIPNEVTNSTMFWSISNTSIATINQIGLVTAVQEGEAIITATTTDGSNLSAQCTVQVLPPILVTGIQIPAVESLNIGGRVQLDAVILPENAGNKTLTWSTSDASIATVSEGLVTAIGYGTATITTTVAGGANATCMVTVDPSVQQLRAVAYGLGLRTTNTGRSIMFSGGGQYGKPPYSAKFTLLANGVQLASETVTTNGVETLYYNIGSSVIDATVTVNVDVTDTSSHLSSARTSVQMYVNGWNISITELEKSPLIVKMSGINITPASAIMNVGATQALSVAVVPDSTSDKSLTWGSSSPNIATIEGNGLVTAISPGTTTIAATAQDGSGVSAACVITIKESAQDINHGDANADGSIDIMDLVSIIDFIVSDTPSSSMANADANGDGVVDIMDLVWIIDSIVGG